MLKKIIPFIAFTILCSVIVCLTNCGSSRNFENPNDPDIQKSSNNPDSIQTSGAINNPTVATKSASCLTDCSPTPGISFNFANSFDVTAPNCTVNKVKAFDNGTELMVFVNANCGTRYQVYSAKYSYAGVIQGSYLSMTDCSYGTNGVIDFSVDKGTNNYLVVYTCQANSSSNATKAVSLSTASVLGTVIPYDTGACNIQVYCPSELIWNNNGNTFGYARDDGVFQRFNEQGGSVGGSVTIPSSSILSLSNNNWYAVSNNTCSKITATGNLSCNKINSTIEYGGFILGEQSIYFSTYNITSNEIKITDLDPDKCILSSALSISFSEGHTKLYRPIALTTTYGAALTSSKNKLLIGVFTRTGALKISTEASIANFSTLSSADIKIINGKIYAIYAADSKGIISFTNENVPQ